MPYMFWPFGIIRRQGTDIHLNLEFVMSTIRWSLSASRETDQSVRMFLASQGGMRKGDLSRFIEEAVRAHLLEKATGQAKTGTVHLSEQKMEDLIDKAVVWARKN